MSVYFGRTPGSRFIFWAVMVVGRGGCETDVRSLYTSVFNSLLLLVPCCLNLEFDSYIHIVHRVSWNQGCTFCFFIPELEAMKRDFHAVLYSIVCCLQQKPVIRYDNTVNNMNQYFVSSWLVPCVRITFGSFVGFLFVQMPFRLNTIKFYCRLRTKLVFELIKSALS